MNMPGKILTVILLALLAAACGRVASSRMDAVDSLMTERPDSALAILRTVTPDLRTGRAQEARYDMLLTEALYRNDADSLLSDSVIGVASDHYELRHDDRNAARALWLAGIVESSRGNSAKATVKLLRAEKYALRDSAEHMRLGLIYRSLGDCFSEYYDITTSAGYFKKALFHFTKAEAHLHAGYVAVQTACRSLDLREYNNVKYYSGIAERISRNLDDVNLWVASQTVLADSYVKQGKYEEAIRIYEPLLSVGCREFQEKDYMNLGLAYLISGNPERAEECNSHVNSFESGFNIIELNQKLMGNDPEEAVRLLTATIEKQDSIRNTVWTRNNISTINDFYKREDSRLDEELAKEKSRTWYVSVAFLLFACLVAMIFLYVSQRNRKKLMKAIIDAEALKSTVSFNKEIIIQKEEAIVSKEKALADKNSEIETIRTSLESRQHEVETLKSELSSLGEQKTILSEELKNLEKRVTVMDKNGRKNKKELFQTLSRQISVIDSLLDCYYRSYGTPTEAKALGKAIKSEVDKLIHNEDTFGEIISSANRYQDGLIDLLKKDFPKLNDTLIIFFSLSVLGFSNSAITILQQTTINTTYNRRNILKKTIANSNCERAKLYLKFL